MQNCPNCESDQFKKARLVYDEGVRAGAGVGVGVGSSGLGAGIGVGISSSALAAKCAPPKKDTDAFMKTTGSWLLLIFMVPLLMATYANGSWGETGWFWKVWAGIGVIIAVLGAVEFEKIQEAEFQKALKEYEKTYMCTRCGHLFQPFA